MGSQIPHLGPIGLHRSYIQGKETKTESKWVKRENEVTKFIAEILEFLIFPGFASGN